jgi:hypothetical protein
MCFDDRKASHRLLHVKIQGENPDWKPSSSFSRPTLDPRYFYEWRVEPASVYVSRELIGQFAKKSPAQLRNLLQVATPTDKDPVGCLLEPFALRELAKGGRFEVRLLSHSQTLPSPKTETNPPILTWKQFVQACEQKQPLLRCFVDLDRASITEFPDLEEIVADSADIQVPLSKAFCSVDAVLPLNVPCKVTINTESKLVLSNNKENRSSFNTLVDQLNLNKKSRFLLSFNLSPRILLSFDSVFSFLYPSLSLCLSFPFVWVTTEKNADKFREPLGVVSDPRPVDPASDSLAKLVHQYVLIIPIKQ